MKLEEKYESTYAEIYGFFCKSFWFKKFIYKATKKFWTVWSNKTQFLKKFFINHAAGKNKL